MTKKCKSRATSERSGSGPALGPPARRPLLASAHRRRLAGDNTAHAGMQTFKIG
jgi:hypothetical protein